ncbi:TIGR02281 family clan AA aspartic protease [Rhizobium sp. NTR19]|uniref:TIGR02281 family clan AA aspartic protease n=1 Tax=Neorhizobium turbinariae TaxID=2937795 RepID=A0ABT0IW43_9HYPH|nr:TIGR02281 family clan AA aspartic protease [Neorhizobium turbinariae]MCK8782079.1 TIGR02281 family clan AA aspartic protease [Neorhizobium turbinariae]
MLLRTATIAAIAAVFATQIPALIDRAGPPSQVPATVEDAPPVQNAAYTPGTAVLEADGRGHFEAAFRINGKPVEGLVDTGASLVAINETTARRLGFGANSLDFRYNVNTANGPTEAAHIKLSRMEIGGVRVQNIDAFVLRDRGLSGTLVGMSFLKKLKSFQVEGGKLKLTQ